MQKDQREAFERLKKLQRKIIVKTLDGDKEYTFQLLKRREAAKVFHETLLVVAKAFSKLLGKEKFKAEDLLGALEALDFETFNELAKTLLKNAIVDTTELGPDLDESEYYEDKPLELYIAVGYAILCNWPGVFSKIQNALKGSGILDKFKTALDSDKEE